MKVTRKPIRFERFPKDYVGLCKLLMPRPVHGKVDLENVTEMAEAFAGPALTEDQTDYFDLLSSLIETFDREHVPPAKVSVWVDRFSTTRQNEFQADKTKCSRSHIALLFHMAKDQKDNQSARLGSEQAPNAIPITGVSSIPLSVMAEPVASLVTTGLIGPPPRPGLLGIVDHFELVKRIGSGSMGIVFLAA